MLPVLFQRFTLTNKAITSVLVDFLSRDQLSLPIFGFCEHRSRPLDVTMCVWVLTVGKTHVHFQKAPKPYVNQDSGYLIVLLNCPSISFHQSILIEHQLYARYCSRCWEHSSVRDKVSVPVILHSNGERQNTKQGNFWGYNCCRGNKWNDMTEMEGGLF